ncbi:MAG: peptide chain release factor 1 [Lentisphaeria bacterium]
MDLANYIQTTDARFQEVERAISSFDFNSGNTEKYKSLNREYQKLKKLKDAWDEAAKLRQELQDNTEMLKETEDEEFRELVENDINANKKRIGVLEREIKALILPTHPNEGKDVIVEIRPAAGGDEAALFAADLSRMYQRYSDMKGWNLKVLEEVSTALGGIKNIAFTIKGDDAWSILHFESGVHRVQRVPVTETQGRVHTSTVTVAVMAEAAEVDFQLDPEDLRIDVFRASGNGGQCVNTTDSAVRVTHIPTGMYVASQQEKSQHRNKEIAMILLRSRLLEIEQNKEDAKNAAERKSQIGTGDRSERIRTYNYPENRVSDHRYKITLYDLSNIIAGNMDGLLGEIRVRDAEQRLSTELGLEK